MGSPATHTSSGMAGAYMTSVFLFLAVLLSGLGMAYMYLFRQPRQAAVALCVEVCSGGRRYFNCALIIWFRKLQENWIIEIVLSSQLTHEQKMNMQFSTLSTLPHPPPKLFRDSVSVMHPGGGLKLEGTLPSRGGGGFADIKLGLGRGKSVQSAIFF